ncbi:hypothetical protein niasHS_000254 [Heterodera schachtii]|uniref:Uncharacterized protein n=1 Tax=Heterodera schachtii TaxID=97005 RepID=A0ABD2KI25_HETSC
MASLEDLWNCTARHSNQFDAACAELVRKFEKGWQQLNHRVQERVATNLEELERQIKEHKAFEDALKTLDVDVSNVKELYRQLPHPTPTQRAAAHDNMLYQWNHFAAFVKQFTEEVTAVLSANCRATHSVAILVELKTKASAERSCATTA